MTLFKEINVSNDLSRAQDNIGRKFNQLENKTEPSLVEEREGSSQTDQLKSYGQGEYEIYHNLGKQAVACSIASSDGLCTIYMVSQDTNPDNLDRKKFVRVYIQPLTTSGSNIVTTTANRKLSFWVA